jgi:hypothetical protein
MALSLTRLFGTGGSDHQPEGPGNPSLLRKILAVLAGAVGGAPAWSSELTVTTHTVTLSTAGAVLSVDATTATAAGGKVIQSAGSPAAGAVQVAYDAAGIPTLTFNATDAVTGCKVLQNVLSELITVES